MDAIFLVLSSFLLQNTNNKSLSCKQELAEKSHRHLSLRRWRRVWDNNTETDLEKYERKNLNEILKVGMLVSMMWFTELISCVFILAFEALWLLLVPPALTFYNYKLYMLSVFVSSVQFSGSKWSLPETSLTTDLRIRDKLYFLWRTDWTFNFTYVIGGYPGDNMSMLYF
jgi:hypothetical protein